MIYDCFLFYNELDILEIRLNTLNSVVDKFVLVEGTVTHTNQKKALFYQQNKARFSKFNDKIIHVVVNDSPNVSMPWIIERYQLEAVMNGLGNCSDNDLILYSAVDEIPNPEKIIKYQNSHKKNIVFLQNLYYYYLNLKEISNSWRGTRMFYFKNLKDFKNIYFTRYLKPDLEISDGGWHFSYIADSKGIQRKIESMAHQEFNNENFNTPEKIKMAILQKRLIFNKNIKLEVQDISTLPEYVQENRERFKKYIIDSNSGFFLESLFLLTKDKLRIKAAKIRKMIKNK